MPALSIWWSSLHERSHFYLVFLFAVSLPLPAYALANVLLILLAVNWLVELGITRKMTIDRTDQIMVFCSVSLFVFYLIGVFNSSNVPEAWAAVVRKLPLLFLPLIFATSRSLNRNEIQKILVGFLLSCAVIVVLCVAYTIWVNKKLGVEFAIYNNYQFSDDNLTRKFGFHHVYFSMYLSFCQIIILCLFLRARSVFWRLAMVFLAAFMFLFMLGLASRMGLLIFVAITVLSIFLLSQQHFFSKVAITATFIVATAFAIYQFPFAREKFTGLMSIDLNDYSQRYKASYRIIPTLVTWNAFRDNWLLGMGSGDLNGHLLKEYERLDFQEGLIHTYNPHNQYLDTAASVGVFGLMALLGFLASIIVKSLKIRDLMGIAFSIIVVLSFATESMLSRQKGVVFFALFSSLLMVNRDKSTDAALLKY